MSPDRGPVNKVQHNRIMEYYATVKRKRIKKLSIYHLGNSLRYTVKCKMCGAKYSIVNQFLCRETGKNIVISRYSLALELIKPGTHRILMKEHVSALGACSGLIARARICMSHDAAPQEKNASLFGTHWFLHLSRVPE